MKTEVYKIDPENPDMDIIALCADVIKNGGTVAFPTETVYGLGANALDDTAVKKIFSAKGRPNDNPLILHVAGITDVEKYAVDIPPFAYTLARIFWPGPLSMVLWKNDLVPMASTGGLHTAAFRVPSNNIALAIINQSGVPIAAPSANLSGKPSPTDGAHVIEDLSGRVDIILDAGGCRIGLESTVMDLTSSPPVVLRPGGISFDELRMVVPHLMKSYDSSDSEAPKSPGMKYTHYSPDASVIVVKGALNSTVEKINEITNGNPRAGVLCSLETVDLYRSSNKICAGSRKNPQEIASRIFGSLRMFNKLDVDIIYSEYFDVGPMEDAIMNRLLKAASFEIIET
ncbi:MAG: L-threonylcarbamoyladenylate synthase [Clostridia bacterium]